MTGKPMHDDQLARERIASALDANLMVEAGAGSGKTTALVGRIVALIARGTPVEQVAAVTFTRKAAGELRERLQERLEGHLRAAAAGTATLAPEVLARFERARRDLDRAFLGTIHAFCARLLRERPLEAGLDPAFEELDDLGWEEAKGSFWRRWLGERRREADADIVALGRVGLDARLLEDAFGEMVQFPDVEFPVVECDAPDTERVRRALEGLMQRAAGMMPETEPAKGWDDLQSTWRRLQLLRRVHDWRDPVQFCQDLATLSKSGCKPTFNRWTEDKEDVRGLGDDFASFVDGDAATLLRRWREHRYPLVIRLLKRAAGEFARERLATGRLSFEDLLLATAALLRGNPGARRELGSRWAHLLVDEFQDTDPIQAEVCLLLASDPEEGTDWRRVTPRPGALFVVGDPKQSIYRFRRADIGVYNAVKARFAEFGEVLHLSRNFRSVDAIGVLVNAHFEAAFAADAAQSPEAQATFTPLVTGKAGEGSDGVYRYGIALSGRSGSGAIWADDPERLAAWIARRVTEGRAKAGDFMVLLPQKAPIARYARALAARNVAVTTTGANLPQERELRELRVVLAALADPDNGVLVAAALEGYFFGLSPADLYAAKRAGLRFGIAHPPASGESPVGAALAQLHEWWRLAQRHPADVVVEVILDGTGLLPYAASQELGDLRAGALLHIVESLRAASVQGTAGIVDALAHIDLLLAAEAPDVPLRPGRSDAVRVMNIHKAKGLEAPIVVLAGPTPRPEFEPTRRIVRDADGSSRGWMVVALKKDGFAGDEVLAQPPEWEEVHLPAESAFEAAERTRLLYVAATRARQELVVAESRRSTQAGPQPCTSLWAPLCRAMVGEDPVLSELAHLTQRRDLLREQEQGIASVRRALSLPAAEIAVRAAAAQARTGAAAMPTHAIVTVTESAKRQLEEKRHYDLSEGRGLGVQWGRAVHRSLEGALRGRRGDSLRSWVRACAAAEALDLTQVTQLEALVERVLASDAWRSLAAGVAVAELPVMYVDPGSSDGDRVVEGVIDAAVLDQAGWTVLDWKTDRGDAEWERREATYQSQVRQYAEVLQALTGVSAVGRIERVVLPD